MENEEVKKQLQQIIIDLDRAMPLTPDVLLVMGTSTSEVGGAKIGSSGSDEIAKAIYDVLIKAKKEKGIQLAFQCCEHLNRALVVEAAVAKERAYEQVSVIPVKEAGGAMATYAYRQMENPVVVEEIKAEAGIDIGDTFIGMHLKKVAVPIRSEVKKIGEAHVTMAVTRPKLIGGARAKYE